MGKITLRPVSSVILYQGEFSGHAFRLFANSAVFYQNLFLELAPYGANLNSLKVETSVIADANISLSLLDLNTLVQIKLDRLDVNFLKFAEVGNETAQRILQGAWKALKDTTGSPAIKKHNVHVTVNCEIAGASYNDLVERYVSIPHELPGAGAGVVFYLPGNDAKGEDVGSIVLDRSSAQDTILLKVGVAFDAARVPSELLAQRVSEYLERQLERIGLALEEEDENG